MSYLSKKQGKKSKKTPANHSHKKKSTKVLNPFNQTNQQEMKSSYNHVIQLSSSQNQQAYQDAEQYLQKYAQNQVESSILHEESFSEQSDYFLLNYIQNPSKAIEKSNKLQRQSSVVSQTNRSSTAEGSAKFKIISISGSQDKGVEKFLLKVSDNSRIWRDAQEIRERYPYQVIKFYEKHIKTIDMHLIR